MGFILKAHTARALKYRLNLMILFLSFDGVLHATGKLQQKFDRLAMLEQWLRQHPEVNIVISSKWRNSMDIAELRQLFNEDVRHRVLGVTPGPRDQAHDRYWRLSEIFDWLQYCGTQQEWLVLDDGVFPERFNRLVKCNPLLGLTDQDLDSLTRIKRQLLAQQPGQRLNQLQDCALA